MNRLKLEYEIKSRGFTLQQVADNLEISRSALYRKLNGKSEFTRTEIQIIVDLLGLDSATAMTIFFAD